ncbi:MAG: hypothetical protein ABH858_03010, partial [Candidatus Omnitrophota bacterium]
SRKKTAKKYSIKPPKKIRVKSKKKVTDKAPKKSKPKTKKRIPKRTLRRPAKKKARGRETLKKEQRKPIRNITKKLPFKEAKKARREAVATNKPGKSKQQVNKKLEEKEIGVVSHYFDKISVGVIKLSAPLKIGDKIQIKGAQGDFTQSVRSMQVNRENISRAKAGIEVGIKVISPVRYNDKVYISADK